MTTHRNDDAYPATAYYDERPTGSSDGLTKREFFAAMALQGLLASPTDWARPPAEQAVDFADALIAALNKEEPNEF